MQTMPNIQKNDDESSIWTHSFNTFEATVYMPVPKKELLSDVLNYGFISPYILIFAEEKFTPEQAINFAKEKGFEQLASDFASSVVFIYPTSGDWDSASSEIFSEIITNSRIHQYYENGVVKAWNRFTDQIEGYFIRGAIFRTCLYGWGKSADYIAKNCLCHFEGDGLWGRSDLAPVTVTLTNLTVMPQISASDIPLISYNNNDELNKVFQEKCTHFVCRKNPDFINDYYTFAQKFRRMIGELQIDPDLQSLGLIREPCVISVKTSSDNNGDDKNTKEHKIGYFAFYNSSITRQEKPVPLVLGFHGGGDSCFFFSIMAGWQKIAHRHNFLLVTVENHLNSTATEMQELIAHLKTKYNIDESRIYATGFSMGGIKTWDFVQEYPSVLAACAPMDATVDIGENVYFQKISGQVNTSVSVPIFYAGGEVTPLPELPFQEQKCLNRMAYALSLNNANAKYEVKLEEHKKWKNKIWGIDGDITYKAFDKSRNATLTCQLFKNNENKIYNVFASISEQGHDCREHTCEHAWRFMSQFSRDKNGTLIGGEENAILDSFKEVE